jgi:KDO2-lipid IV(A) lauroyltransferase
LGFHKRTELYRITLININLCYPNLSNKEQIKLAKESVIETMVSGYESMLSWSRPIHISGKNIFKVENNYLLSQNAQNNNGLIVIAIHSRSVDMLLKWINSKSKTTSLYKKIKNKTLDSFVKNEREKNNNETYETGVSGVRKIFKSLLSKNVICLAADQVPQAGMGEYVKFFNRDAYTTTLASSLAYKTGKPVIYCSMNSDNNKNLFVSIKPCHDDIYNDSKRLHSMNNSIENLININPKDYSWEYKRFKKAQPKNIDPYLKA